MGSKKKAIVSSHPFVALSKRLWLPTNAFLRHLKERDLTFQKPIEIRGFLLLVFENFEYGVLSSIVSLEKCLLNYSFL